LAINEQTPISKYIINNNEIFVKREDLFSTYPAPSLAKLRGIIKYVEKLEREGVKLLGILDTRISKSGWGLAYLCNQKNIEVICFYPKLKAEKELPKIQQMEKQLGAEVYPLQAGRISILYSQAKKIMIEKGGHMMPMGLVLEETKNEVSKLINKEEYEKFKSIVVSLGTGTICAEIIDGVEKNLDTKPKIYGVSCGMNISKIKKRITSLLQYKLPENVSLITSNYDYYDEENIHTEFPSSIYYDKKALKWLDDNYNKLEQPVLFWNIGV